MPQLIGCLACAAVLGYGFTWLARIAAPRLGYLDKPDNARKRHGNTTPLLGGVAVYAAFLGTLAVFFAFPNNLTFHDGATNLSLLLGTGGLFCLLGLWDDKRPLSPRAKFALQVLASLPFAVWGPQISVIHLAGFSLTLGSWSLLFTVFWLVSCANIVNLIDGLDGLASSVGVIAVTTVALLSLRAQSPLVSLVALSFAGSIVGFLFHNWPPAKIFLGDAGSLLIGFMVGALAITSSQKTAAGLMIALPLTLLVVPIFDTTIAILRRKLTGRVIGEADHMHIHHRLQGKGLSKAQTLVVLVAICTTMAAVCLLSAMLDQDLVAIGLCLLCISAIITSRVFGFEEFMLVVRHLGIVKASFTIAISDMNVRREAISLEYAEPVSVNSAWEAFLSNAAKLGATTAEVRCTDDRNGRDLFQRSWSAPNNAPSDTAAWKLQYILPRRGRLNSMLAVEGSHPLEATKQGLGQIMLLFESFESRLSNLPELYEGEDRAGFCLLRPDSLVKSDSQLTSDRCRAA